MKKVNSLLESDEMQNQFIGYNLLISQFGISEYDAKGQLAEANQDEVCDLCSDEHFDGISTSSATFLCEGSRCPESVQLYFEHMNDSL